MLVDEIERWDEQQPEVQVQGGGQQQRQLRQPGQYQRLVLC
jgi:hypothetical protein